MRTLNAKSRVEGLLFPRPEPLERISERLGRALRKDGLDVDQFRDAVVPPAVVVRSTDGARYALRPTADRIYAEPILTGTAADPQTAGQFGGFVEAEGVGPAFPGGAPFASVPVIARALEALARPQGQNGRARMAGEPTDAAGMPPGGDPQPMSPPPSDVRRGAVSDLTAKAIGTAAGKKILTETLTGLVTGGKLTDVLGKLTDPGTFVTAAGSTALQMAVGSLIGGLMAGLAPDDESSVAEHAIAKFAPEIQGFVLTQAIAALQGGAGPGLGARIATFFGGVSSSASVPFGKANPAGGEGVVLVEGVPATRQNDIAIMAAEQDVGPFIEGNPTILINGVPAVGQCHKAIGAKGTVAGPELLAATVLMGLPPAVAPKVSTDAGGAGGGGGGCFGGGGGAGGSASGAGAGGPSSDHGSPCALDLHPEEPLIQIPEWMQTLFGVESETHMHDGKPHQDISILWGAIGLGSPQEPGAGTTDTWWIPDSVFGWDMKDYYLFHDCHFDFDLERDLSDLDEILGIEWSAFLVGLKPDPVHIALQVIYSSATLTVALGSGIYNTLRRPFRTDDGVSNGDGR